MSSEKIEKSDHHEAINDPEAIALVKDAGQLRFSYLTNQICLHSLAEDLREGLIFLRGGKNFVDIVEPILNDLQIRWKKLVESGKLPNSTIQDLEEFSKESEQFIQDIKRVNEEVPMTDEDKEEIQQRARSMIVVLDRLIALEPEEK